MVKTKLAEGKARSGIKVNRASLRCRKQSNKIAENAKDRNESQDRLIYPPNDIEAKSVATEDQIFFELQPLDFLRE